jgi:hypothetical protein
MYCTADYFSEYFISVDDPEPLHGSGRIRKYLYRYSMHEFCVTYLGKELNILDEFVLHYREHRGHTAQHIPKNYHHSYRET